MTIDSSSCAVNMLFEVIGLVMIGFRMSVGKLKDHQRWSSLLALHHHLAKYIDLKN